MKIKSGFILRRVGDDSVVVPVGERTNDFNGMIRLNSTGALLWKALENEANENELVSMLKEKYEVSEETARKAVSDFTKKLETEHLIKK